AVPVGVSCPPEHRRRARPRDRHPRGWPVPRGQLPIFGEWGLFTQIVGSNKRQLDLPELFGGRVVIGGPEECAAELARLVEAVGLRRLVCRVQWMGMDQRLVLRTIERLADRVVPLVARAMA